MNGLKPPTSYTLNHSYMVIPAHTDAAAVLVTVIFIVIASYDNNNNNHNHNGHLWGPISGEPRALTKNIKE